MRVIPPLTIDDTVLTSSTVNEPDIYAEVPEEVWNAATSYNLGDIVIRTETHRKYENTLAGINADLPESTAAADRWLDIGPTNKYAMVDLLRNTQTITSSPLVFTLSPGARVDAIALMAMEAQTVNIVVNNGVEDVYDYTQDLTSRSTASWYDYFFGEFETTPSIVRFDLPPFAASTITVTLTSTAPIKLGAVVVGRNTYVGKLQFNAISEELNFSRIEREFDGTSVLLQRRSIPKLIGEVICGKERVNGVRELRRQLNAVPAVWSGLDDMDDNDYFEAVLILGIYKKFEIDISYPLHARVSLEVEEI